MDSINLNFSAFEKFMSCSLRNAWIDFEDISIYFRKSSRYFDHQLYSTLDIASIQSVEEGQGIWTKFIHLLKEHPSVLNFKYLYVESVLSPRFANWFRKNDWLEIKKVYIDECPCFYITTTDFVKSVVNDLLSDI